jgi:type VI secretion system protein ImpG
MLNRFYEQELASLREAAVEFSRAHPALAPMLGGASADPDVERLLEGVAFLTGMVRQKLDDEFPEFIQELAHLLLPHYLRPIPSATILQFSAKGKLGESARVRAGTAINSVPVDGTPCLFRTCFDVEAHPLALTSAQLVDIPGKQPFVKLTMALDGMDIVKWRGESLRFYLGGSLPDATNLLALLLRYVDDVVISVPGGSALVLGADALVPAGLAPENILIPYPSHAYPGYRLLQEYFVLPEKFLFVDLKGMAPWAARQAGKTSFEIEFRLSKLPDWAPEIRADSFMLNATPAINVFEHAADPIQLDHKRPEYRVMPSGGPKHHYQVYEIDEVVGFQQGVAHQKVYHPFGLFRYESVGETSAYRTLMRPSTVAKGQDLYLSVAYSPTELPKEETLSIRMKCTNGTLPESLRVGDISRPTDTSPERLQFRNIRVPTPHLMPPTGEMLLWRLMSHLTVNFLAVATRDNLRALLSLYLFSGQGEQGGDNANRKRVEAVTGVSVEAANRLVSGVMMRGRNIRVTCRSDGFASIGDLFLFGCVIEQFMGCYASINAYTRFELEDQTSGEVFRWPERLGQQPLI